MKIVFDVLGGDNAPMANLEAAKSALLGNADLELVLVGDEAVIKSAITDEKLLSRVEILHTTENISCEEQPTVAIRQRVNSSMVMGLDALKQRADCHGFVSAGSTGALLTGGFMKLGRIEGVSRPALCPLMPTVVPGQKVMLVDAGANVDCKPQNLAHFALMGDAYMKALGVASPRIALVNVGTEEGKGNELTHQTFDILKKLPINFVGNMEARDTFTGEYDILVADGFVGNVLLKTAEGSTAFLMSHLKRAIKGGFWSKFGALFMRKAFKKVKKLTSEEAAGGSPFLGIKKPVIKAHGNSTAVAFENALSVAIACARADLSEQIKTAIAESAAVING